VRLSNNNKNKWGLRFIVNAQRVVGNRLMQLRTSFTPMSNPLRAIYVRLSDVVVGSWWQRVKTITQLKYRHALETRRLHIFYSFASLLPDFVSGIRLSET